MKKVFLLLFGCLLLIQCGYHLRGTGSALPPHIKKVHIPMFKNRTTRFELDLKLTQRVIDELVARGKVEIIPNQESADSVLLCDLLSFRATPIGFTGEAAADRYSITVVARIIMRDLVERKIIFSNPSFVYRGEYDVPEGSDFEAVETEALDEIAEKFARSLVSTLLEGF